MVFLSKGALHKRRQLLKGKYALNRAKSFLYPYCTQKGQVSRPSDSRDRGCGFNTQSSHILPFLFPLIQEGQLSVTGKKYVNEILVNSKGGLSPPRKRGVWLADCPDMTSAVYRGC